ncbi:MAG: 2,3-bisphosphoglycerate-independent phosphoglycerate mutase, partial [Armatimonadota bacterium]
VGSDTGHMAILGYDPFKHYRGRGPFEARGVGLEVKPGDVAFRCNFATVDENGVIQSRRAGRIEAGTDQLREIINEEISEIEDVQILFKESVAHRAALVLRGENLDEHITPTDPHVPGVEYWKSEPLEGYEDNEAARRTAKILNAFVERTREVLDDAPLNEERRAEGKHPANIVLPRGAGTAVDLEPFEKRYEIPGAMIVEVDLVRGLGEYLQMKVPRVTGATGGPDTDEIAIADEVVDSFQKNDFILANIKAPDLGGHDGDVAQKIAAIEKVDRAIGHIIDNTADMHLVTMVAADHCTPCAVRDHSGEPIPTIFYGYGVTPDGVQSYGERACAQGMMGHFRGADVMNLLMNWAGAAEKFGA